jgi:2-phospho-L-lactate/phosphoenolpyruvate guanylyltransferase
LTVVLRTAAVLPVKSFGLAKQRLGNAFPDRPTLAEAMVGDVLAALARVPGLDDVIVVTAEPAAARAARAAGAHVVHDPEEAGQSAAAARGIAAAVERGADRALLVPGDCPALAPAEVAALLERTAPAVIVPDRHGTGTNALLLTPPDAIAPAFGPGSFARHSALAGGRAEVCEVPSLGLDVDTPDDLAALRAALGAHAGGASRTRALLDEQAPAAA